MLTGVWSFLLLAVTAPALAPLDLPGGAGGIGFDDMRFSPMLGKVLVPAGRTGRLVMIDPRTRAIDAIEGFSVSDVSGHGHGAGTTSADTGRGLLFAIDRNARAVDLVDPVAKRIVSSAKLAGGPDYVRWVEPLGEVWVTEPQLKQIECFHFEPGAAPRLTSAATIEVANGPEALAIDATRGRAYTHTWTDTTMAIDLKRHAIVARWANGCDGARGIALDEKRGFLFVGCEEGRAVALDAGHGGTKLGSVATGKGVDIIAFSTGLSHLYVPGGDDATLTIAGVDAAGRLSVLGTSPAAPDSHCVAADDLGNAYVCDPGKGRVLILADPFPASR
jgi:hypothetical protein